MVFKSNNDLAGFATGPVPLYTSDIIRVHVVTDNVTVTVHKDLIKGSSKFFATALSDVWTDSQRPVRLAEGSADDFRTYVHWLYTGKLVVQGNDMKVDFFMPFILPLYGLGTYLMDNTFLNFVITSFISQVSSKQAKDFVMDRSFVISVYMITLAKDPLRALVADLVIKQGMQLGDDVTAFDVFCDFSVDVALRMLPWTFKRQHIELSKSIPAVCKYHHHPPGVTCADERTDAAPTANQQPGNPRGLKPYYSA